jgi:MYXO-CTERM domain-containing protein
MTLLKSLKKAVGIGIAVLFCSASAQAAVTWTTWNLKDGATPTNEKSVGSAGNQTTITAWGNTSGTNGTANAEYRPRDLHEYSGGIGAGPGSSPRHAVGDWNVHEFILLEFDMPTTLTDLQIGWRSNDSDMTIMAFTGGSFTRSDMYDRNSDLLDTTGTTRGLTNAGWELISNPMNVQTNVLTSIGNNTNVSSSYWLIGTYNNHLNGTNSSSYNDFFKLKLVKGYKGEDNGVPLPTTAALLGLGLLALGRRRYKVAK